MVKELSEMTVEELWNLFPIILKEYNTEYPSWYEVEKEKLVEQFDNRTMVRISHIGSTAVPGLLSKPTIDILMEISQASDTSQVAEKLKEMQWILMHDTDTPTFKQTYNKGYTKYGFEEKVYHLHVRYAADWRELYFRDYLMEHPEIAKQYANLKRQLKERFEHNRDAYTDAKEEFVKKYSKAAKLRYGKRYEIYEN